MSAGRCFGHGPVISLCVLIEHEPQADVLLGAGAAEPVSVTLGVFCGSRLRFV